MTTRKATVGRLFGLLWCSTLLAQAPVRPIENVPETPTAQWPKTAQMTDFIEPWRELRNSLSEKGISFNVGATQVFQFGGGGPGKVQDGGFLSGHHGVPSPGGITSRNAANYTLSLDVDLTLDFGKLVSPALDGLTFFIYMDSGFGEGYDPQHLDSIGGVNYDMAVPYGPLVAEYWFQYAKTVDRLALMVKIGKIDTTTTFDNNAYANDETRQFLNSYLVVNPYTLAANSLYKLGVEGKIAYEIGHDIFQNVSLASGIFAANANDSTWGFHEAFQPNYGINPAAFWITEAGLGLTLPSANGQMPGNYRFGFVYSGLPAQVYTYNTYGGALPPKYESGYNAFYISADQMVYKENADEKDEQGLGLFFRYGTGNQNAVMPGVGAPMTSFWSFGASYTGLIPTRNKDVTGFGYALSALNEYQPLDSTAPRLSNQQVFEWYYNIHVFDWLEISPDLQYIIHPGGFEGARNAVVGGLRMQIVF